MDGTRSPFQVWRTHLTDWERITVDSSVQVFSWEDHLVVRSIGVHVLAGFTQAIRIIMIGNPSSKVIQLASSRSYRQRPSSEVLDRPATPEADSPSMPELEPLTDDDASASLVGDDEVDRADSLLFESAQSPSPTLSYATSDPVPVQTSAPPTDYDDGSSNASMSSPPRGFTPPPSSQPRRSPNCNDYSWHDSDAGPSNAALAALLDSPGTVILPVSPSPVRKRKRRRLNTEVSATSAGRVPYYLLSPIDLTNDSD